MEKMQRARAFLKRKMPGLVLSRGKMLNEVPYKYKRKFLLVPRTCTSTRKCFSLCLPFAQLRFKGSQKKTSIFINFSSAKKPCIFLAWHVY
jgi:hypothetical protein